MSLTCTPSYGKSRPTAAESTGLSGTGRAGSGEFSGASARPTRGRLPGHPPGYRLSRPRPCGYRADLERVSIRFQFRPTAPSGHFGQGPYAKLNWGKRRAVCPYPRYEGQHHQDSSQQRDPRGVATRPRGPMPCPRSRPLRRRPCRRRPLRRRPPASRCSPLRHAPAHRMRRDQCAVVVRFHHAAVRRAGSHVHRDQCSA